MHALLCYAAAATYLKKTGSPKVGCIGYCMGGALSLASIQHAKDISCGVVCYGLPPQAICDPTKVTKPVQGHFGEEDNLEGFSDAKSAKKVRPPGPPALRHLKACLPSIALGVNCC